MLKVIKDKFKAKKTDDASNVAASNAPPSPRHRVDHHITDPITNVVYVKGKVLGKVRWRP
jgi:IS4 transposase